MRYFDALATTGHFRRAAELVHISQPALSAQIMEMEEYLGAKLFERMRTSTILTHKGQEVLFHVHAILHQVDLLEQTARKGDGLLAGLIRIGIIPTVAPYLVPQFIPHLRQTYPSVEVELKEAVTDRLMADLATGKLDAVIAALPLDVEGIQTRPLFTDRFYMAVAENGETVLLSPLTENEVNVDRLLLLEEGHCLRDQAVSACHLPAPGDRKLFSATSLPTLIQMVDNGLGSTLLPAMAVAGGALKGSAIVTRPLQGEPARGIGLAWRRADPRRGEYKLLGQEIAELAQRYELAGATKRP